MIKIIGGGQTGADRGGWRAAKGFVDEDGNPIETGGWMPKGFLAEDGAHPEFAELYGAKEHTSSRYPPRTKLNVRESDLTMIFDVAKSSQVVDMSRGTQLAVSMAQELDRLCLVIRVDLSAPPLPKRAESIREWLEGKGVRVVNVAGNRESTAPGIGAWVEAYMREVFKAMGFAER